MIPVGQTMCARAEPERKVDPFRRQGLDWVPSHGCLAMTTFT